MDRAEVLSVKAKTGDMEQMGEVINILRGKEDAAFDIFCDLLRRSNYGVWAQELVSSAECGHVHIRPHHQSCQTSSRMSDPIVVF